MKLFYKELLLLLMILLQVSCSETDINMNDSHAVLWQANVEASLGRSLNPTKSAGTADIELVGYEYYGEVPQTSDYSRIINRMFSGDTYVVLQSNAGGNKLIYDKIRNCSDYGDWAVERLEFFKQEATKALAEGTGLVELEWRIDGKKEVTLAIVHDSKGVLYDNICSFVADESKLCSEMIDGEEFLALNSLQTRAEQIGNRKVFHISDSSTTLFGAIEYWRYDIYCESKFNSSGILVDRQTKAEATSNYGWSCQANIQILEGVLQHSTFNEFAWGYGYGQGDVTITWTGLGYSITIPGGGHQASGFMVHRAYS